MSVHMKVAIIGPCLWTDETKKLFLSCAYMGEGQMGSVKCCKTDQCFTVEMG